MFSVTIKAESAAHLAALAEHLKAFEAPAFLRSEIGKPKAATAAVPSAVPTPSALPVEAPKAEKPKVAKAPKKEEKSALTYDDDVKAATFAVAGIPGKGPNLITGILGEFGVGHAKELTEEQWPEYIEKCKAIAEKNKEPANFA